MGRDQRDRQAVEVPGCDATTEEWDMKAAVPDFLHSRIRSIQRESMIIVKKFELEILTNLHVLDLPESEKHNFGIMSVNTITRKLLEIRG
ncbi:hypothetical protein AVEN_97817-1 [Araneus ventricosus]|uniref:Uncharacterized protein n=1 Tax=Araneus ventricosus TaxID=182803 RepID=A0A4Y2K7H3_ARAVE|nr:hypothetical protein AVEN_97817-1 [Araneus ventricosus]